MFPRNTSLRWLAVILTLALLSGLIFSVSAQDGSILRVGTESPVDLDPATGSNDPETLFNRMIYDYLIDVASDNSLVPNLAESWTISEDGLTYVLKLREGVTFHDGSAFGPADVVFTFNRLKELGSPAMSLLGDFEVSASGDNEVTFTLAVANADFLFGLSSRFALILKDGTASPNVLDESGANRYVNFNGTGPFILTDYKQGESATFAKNANYWWEGQPALDGIELIFIQDTLAQVDALRSGTVDFIFKLPISQVSVLENEAGITIVERPTNRHPVIRLRSDEGFAGADVRVRQALKHATDRELLNLDVEEGRGVVGNNDPIGPAYGVFYNPADVQEHDPAKACELIKAAGFEDSAGNARLELDFYVVDAFNYAELATNLQQQWEEGCIFVNLLVREAGVYYAGDPGEWMEVELGLTGWGDRPIPQAYLTEAYISSGIYNESHWSTPELDALITEAAVTADIDARAGLYAQISQIFNEEGPIIIPYFASIIGAVSDRVSGLDLNPFAGRTDFRTVTISN